MQEMLIRTHTKTHFLNNFPTVLQNLHHKHGFVPTYLDEGVFELTALKFSSTFERLVL